MKNLICILFVIFASVFANADTITLTSLGSNTLGEVYTYPYYFDINGSSTNIPLMCISYDNEIVLGESWTVTTTSLIGLSPLYLETAWLLNDAIANPSSSRYDNLAAWGLFSNNVPIDSNSNIQLVLAINNYKNINPNDFVLYTPTNPVIIVNGSGGTAIPQTFIGVSSVPESSSLAFIGLGLMFLYVVGKKKYQLIESRKES